MLQQQQQLSVEAGCQIPAPEQSLVCQRRGLLPPLPNERGGHVIVISRFIEVMEINWKKRQLSLQTKQCLTPHTGAYLERAYGMSKR